MSKKLTILELVKYYVDRYNLDTRYRSGSDEYKGDGYGTYKQAITRILKNTFISNKSLWDLIKEPNSPRRISIEEFENECFPAWKKYLDKNVSDKDEKAIEEDFEKYEPGKDKAYWNQRAEKRVEEQNEYIREHAADEPDPNHNYDFSAPTDEEIKALGHEYMLEALYSASFETFKWDELRQDMYNDPRRLPDYGEYNSSIEGKHMKAEYRLSDFRNYIGRKK